MTRRAAVDVSVLSPVHDVDDARLDRLVDALVGAGLSVEVVGTGDPGSGPVGAQVRALPRVGRVRRLARAATLPARARGRVVVTISPDVALAAAFWRHVRRRPWVADVYEDYLPLLEDRAWAVGLAGRVARALARLSDRVVASADLTTVADEHVPPRAARERIVLRNLPAPLEVPTAERDAQPRAIYVGDVRRSRGLSEMLAMIELAPEWELDVVGPVAEADADSVEAWRATSPAAGRVRFHGRLRPAAVTDVTAGAWVGVALLASTPAFRRALPSKVYEYAAAGLALLASPLPRVADVVREHGIGRVVSGADEAAEALREWSADPCAQAGCAQAARQWWATQEAGRAAYDEFGERVRALAAHGARRAAR